MDKNMNPVTVSLLSIFYVGTHFIDILLCSIERAVCLQLEKMTEEKLAQII